MKKRRALPSRRRRALGWVTALCAALLVNHVLGLYCVTPGQALNQAAARYGLSSVRLWKTLDLSWSEGQTYALAYNERYLMFNTLRFDILKGWSAEPVVLMPEDSKPVSMGMGVDCQEVENGYETVYLFFGMVHDPDVAAVEMAVRHTSYEESGTGVRPVYFPWQRVRVPSAEFQTAGDRRMFLAVLDPVYDPGGSAYPEFDLRFTRESGESASIESVSGYLERDRAWYAAG